MLLVAIYQETEGINWTQSLKKEITRTVCAISYAGVYLGTKMPICLQPIAYIVEKYIVSWHCFAIISLKYGCKGIGLGCDFQVFVY